MPIHDYERKRIIEEARRLAADALYSEKGHFVAAGRFTKVHYWLSIPATLLAAAAGATFLTDAVAWLPPVLAFLASALSAVATFVKPDQVASQHLATGVRYAVLRRELRQFCQIHARALEAEADALTARLEAISTALGEAQAQAKAIPGFAYRAATKAIERGSADYTEADLDAATGKLT